MTESNGKISLITPVCNTGQYIQETLESIKSQTPGFEKIEWVLMRGTG